MGLTVLRTLNLDLKDCCHILSIGLGWSARCMGTNCRSLIVYQQQAEPVCVALLVQSWGRGWLGRLTLFSLCLVICLGCSFLQCNAVIWEAEPLGPSSLCRGCQMHCPQDGRERLPFMGPETDTKPKASGGSCFGFDANVTPSLSGCL